MAGRGGDLFSRAMQLWEIGRSAEVPCWDLSGQSRLEAALWNLHQLRDGWVTPKLAVGPSARQGYPGSAAEQKALRQKIAALPPLPANWTPDDQRQSLLFKQMHASGLRP